MFESMRQAQQAAIDGEGMEEFDTQQCRAMQEAILSVSYLQMICTHNSQSSNQNTELNWKILQGQH